MVIFGEKKIIFSGKTKQHLKEQSKYNYIKVKRRGKYFHCYLNAENVMEIK